METEKLLCKIVGIESISGNELKIVSFVEDYLGKNGFSCRVIGRNVICKTGNGKQSLLLNSHLDTVPVTQGWKLDPFKPKVNAGKIYGLGSNDAKGSVAAMLSAFISLGNQKFDGKVVLALTCDEETGGEGLEHVIKKVKKPDAAIVGEPTGLNICIAQKGHMVLKIISKGKSAHSSYPEKGVNAIYTACGNIKAVTGIIFNRKHKMLGLPTIAVTMIKGGIKTNIIPSECELTVDVRSTPSYSHEELFAMIKNKLKGADVVKQSMRLAPRETKKDEKIVKIAQKVLKSKLIGSSTMSDWVFLDCPAIKLGPGNTHMSHKADECIEIAQVKRAAEAYKNIAMGVLS